MGFWPFGGGKRQRVVETEDHGRETFLKQGPPDVPIQREKQSQEEKTNVGMAGGSTGRDDDKSRRLSKSRTPSSKAISYNQPARSSTAPVRPVDDSRRVSRTNSQYNEKGLYQQNPLSQSSLGPENFTVVQAPPTLHAKRPENEPHLPRRKSSKRKAEDFAREREIRMMSSSPIPIPKRPATLYGTGPLHRDSRQIPGPLNRRLERPLSEVSLPMAGSLPDIIDLPNQNSFKVGMLAALSPRPTVRYDANPKSASGKQPVRPNQAIRQAIEEEDVSDKKRIDELADDLDAGGLRELMERDRRRRERKKEADRTKLQRKLQRRAERQREEEAARRARTEAYVRSAPTGGQRTPGLGIAAPIEPKSSTYNEIPANEDDGVDPFLDSTPEKPTDHQSIPNPFDDEKDMDVMQVPQDSDDEEPVVAGAIPVPVRSPKRRVIPSDVRKLEKPSQSTLSPPVSPVTRAVDRSSLSQGSLLNRETTSDVTENASLERRFSEQSGQRLSSWATFFKRGSRRMFPTATQGRATPSEFSNTSRESVSRKPPPVVPSRTFRRSDSATPQRTLSRFREDLPELPISPPDSRVQSPEANVPVRGAMASFDTGRAGTLSSFQTSSARNSTGLQITEQLDRPLPKQPTDLDAPLPISAAMMLSQSLASVDSEASWLSGKPPKRQSVQSSHVMRPSQSSLTRQMPGAFEQSDDDGDNVDSSLISDDANIIPTQTQPGQTLQLLSGNPPVSLSGDEKWHESVGRQATVIKMGGRAKSTEGLLNEFTPVEQGNSSSGEAAEDQDSESPDVDVKESPLLRAKSVDYKGHARHISAGSAKLFDVKRASVQSDLSRPTSAVISARKSDPILHREEPYIDPSAL